MVRRALLTTGRVLGVLLSALLLLICPVAVFGWARSYARVDVFEAIHRARRAGDSTTDVYRISSGRGVVAVNFSGQRFFFLPPAYASQMPDYDRSEFVRTTLAPDQFQLHDRTIWQRLGFNAYSGRDSALGRQGRLGSTNRYWGFRLPYWLIVPVTGVGPWWYLRRLRQLRRRARTRRGLCAGCGYDLRASRERCPECGEVVPTRAPDAPALTGVAA